MSGRKKEKQKKGTNIDMLDGYFAACMSGRKKEKQKKGTNIDMLDGYFEHGMYP